MLQKVSKSTFTPGTIRRWFWVGLIIAIPIIVVLAYLQWPEIKPIKYIAYALGYLILYMCGVFFFGYLEEKTKYHVPIRILVLGVVLGILSFFEYGWLGVEVIMGMFVTLSAILGLIVWIRS